MSFETLKAEVQALPSEERRKLMALLVAMDDSTQPGYAAKLAAKIDDSSPGRWKTIEECEAQLNDRDPSK